MKTAKWILSQVSRASSKHVGLSVICLVLGACAFALDPLLVKLLIDRALLRKDLVSALLLVSGIGLCNIARASFYGLSTIFSTTIRQDCTRSLRSKILAKFNDLSADYHEKVTAGEKSSYLDGDVLQIASLGTDIITQSIRFVLLVGLNLGVMADLDSILTLSVLPLFPLYAFVLQRFRRRLRTSAELTRTEAGKASGIMIEHLSAVTTIQQLRAQRILSHRTAGAWGRMLDAQETQQKLQTVASVCTGVVLASSIVIVLAIGSVRVQHGALTVGALVACYAYIARAFEPITLAVDLHIRLGSVGVAVQRVRSLLEMQPSVNDMGTRNNTSFETSTAFELEHVFLRHDSKVILDDLTFHISVGEHVAIVGSSGAGKSSLVQLLSRTRNPSEGLIKVDGVPIADYALDSLRKRVSYVSQHPVIFATTFRENLRFAKQSAADEELLEVIAMTQLSLLVASLPNGLDTDLGPNGSFLSGGERQRLCLARALLCDAEVLILDEATSALDSVTENLLLHTIAERYKYRSLIVVTHRLQSLPWVKTILFLQNGELIDTGSHNELYSRLEEYRVLYNRSQGSTQTSQSDADRSYLIKKRRESSEVSI